MNLIQAISDDELQLFIINAMDHIIRHSVFEYNDSHRNVIEKMLQYAGVKKENEDYEFKYKTMAIISILEMQAGKTNVILMVGKPNCGKSLFCNVLCAGLKTGAAHSMNSRSNFWLQDLQGKDIYVFEEFSMDVFNANYFKALLEGSMHVMVEKKNMPSVHLERRPVITTGNEFPWKLVSSTAEAFRERSLIILTDSQIPFSVSADPNKRPDLLLNCKNLLYESIKNC
ncbi:helicase [Planaria asexual strain-specific virus-like element type 1]|uniref:helicase n=1 Tax=Planaria asexual strain-specific virus-like element type 1 TaxID=159252 RepID=UPI00000F4F65|nr:helicase [Planaria asexual strain-specific virus-like element type 1]AAK53627.1 PASVE_E1 [Planaria asexual strain-specific virus-like element type 1]